MLPSALFLTPMFSYFLWLALSVPAAARLHHSLIPEDPYAFPKYHVAFLNGLPVLNDTAQRWLRDGLQGGELEFLDEPWQTEHSRFSTLRGIDGSAADGPQPLTSPPQHELQPNHRLEHMKIGPHHSYLCLIPPEPHSHDNSFSSAEDAPPEVTLLQSWSLLQPLSGKCLYHRQGWFTYSYCHNSHVRQFREQPHTHPHPAGYKPEEDPEWEAFTLGQAPENPEAGADLTIAEQNALAINLELARGAGNRYLVQRWGDGTMCDKTGRQREIEIQFHCSMTMTDTILFIKETATCHYVLVIQTPRLCGDPVFRSRLESREESTIRCREIISSPEQLEQGDEPLSEAAVPFHIQASEKSSTPPPQQNPSPQTTIDKSVISGILSKLREKKLGNVFSFMDGGLLLEYVNDDGDVVTAYEIDLEGVDDLRGVTKGKQYPLTEDVVNALWDGESDEEEDKGEVEMGGDRPLDGL